jgi:uncharacterized membrane protein
MAFWLIVALAGLVLSVWGLTVLFRKYRQNELSRQYFIAVVVGYIFLVLFIAVDALRPAVTTGPVTVVMLLPVFVSIVIVIRAHRLRKSPSRPSEGGK